VSSLRKPINDIFIHEDRLYAATPEGTFYTSNMENWERMIGVSSSRPVVAFGYRWPRVKSIDSPVHKASFYNKDGKGVMEASSGTPYLGFDTNAGVMPKYKSSY